MNLIATLLPDSHFDAVEVAWMAAVVALACLARYSAWRWDRQMAQARRNLSSRPSTPDFLERMARFDREMDDLFGAEVFAWPAEEGPYDRQRRA